MYVYLSLAHLMEIVDEVHLEDIASPPRRSYSKKMIFQQLLNFYVTYLTVSNMVTSDSRVVTNNTMRPGTISGITQKLPQDMITNSDDGR